MSEVFSVSSKITFSARLTQRFGILFFFSSRRRHTRYIGDWSSDVCSSDLMIATWRLNILLTARSLDILLATRGLDIRSEERRVGKECRLRWSTDPEKASSCCACVC